MKISIVGAGAMGSALAHELVTHEGVEHVQVCDAHARALQELQAAVKSPKLRSFQVDARDVAVMEPILKGSACVIASVDPRLNPSLAELSLAVGSHFCDLGGNEEIVHQQIALDARAKERGLWIVPNCGLSPGLGNILCLRGIEQFDSVEAAHLRVGDVPRYPQPPFSFRISWSAEKVLDDYTDPVHLIDTGEIVECAPLSRQETIAFPEPFGEMEAFCTAGGLSILPEELVGTVQDLDHKTIRWPGHANQMRFLLGLGFGENKSIDVRTHLTYRDVLTRRMRQRLGGVYEDVVVLRVGIQGVRDGQKQTLRYEMIEHFDADKGGAAMRRCTSIPAAAIAVLVASHAVPGGGAAPPEKVIPKEAFYEMVQARGLPIQETWHEGYVPITELV